VLLALVLAGCASQHGHAKSGPPAGGASQHLTTQPRTTTESFRAFSSDGELAIKVGDVASGNCWTTSIAAPSSGAYRCFAGNQILDPCFVPPPTAAKTPPTEVACVNTPWSDALVLHLTTALPKPDSAAGVHRPWAFALANGARCVASTGTVPAVRGINLGYHCADGHDASLLDQAAPMVTADYGDPVAQTLQRVTVTTIWRG
jgi:eukaryotic-like serine/threonine-protein kinase